MTGRGRRLLAAGLDAVTYALAVLAGVAVVVGVVSALLGAGLVGVKYGLFYVGFLVFAVAIAVSWPGSAWKSGGIQVRLFGRGGGVEDDDEPEVPWVDTEPSGESGRPRQTPFQRFVQRLPPARFVPAPPTDRLPVGVKLFLAAIVVHAASFGLEAVLNVPG